MVYALRVSLIRSERNEEMSDIFHVKYKRNLFSFSPIEMRICFCGRFISDALIIRRWNDSIIGFSTSIGSNTVYNFSTCNIIDTICAINHFSKLDLLIHPSDGVLFFHFCQLFAKALHAECSDFMKYSSVRHHRWRATIACVMILNLLN